MSNTKAFIKKEYPTLNDLQKYCRQIFQDYGELTVVKGDLVPKDYSKIFPVAYSKLEYDQLLIVVMHYLNKVEAQFVKRDAERKKSGSGVHTIHEYKQEPINIKHLFQSEDSNSSTETVLAILFLIIVIIVLYVIIKSAMRK
jgi:hypothetical protein